MNNTFNNNYQHSIFLTNKHVFKFLVVFKHTLPYIDIFILILEYIIKDSIRRNKKVGARLIKKI